MSTIDPERLMRYADNELGLPERRLIEEKLRMDPDAQALVAAFGEQRGQLRVAMARDDETGLRQCEQSIDRALEKRRRQQRQTDIHRWALPIAASLLITLIGGILSTHYAEQHAKTETARLLVAQAAEHAKDRELALETRIEALERMLSGNALTWANDISGTKGSITPLRTFQAPDGQWCREYRETTTSPTTKEERLSIACRNNEQDWAAPSGPGSI